MGRWGEMDKKSIVYVLENGIGYLRNEINNDSEKDFNTLWKDYTDLRKLLYSNDGRDLLSTTNQVKFERNLNTIRTKMEKLDQTLNA